MSKEELIKSGDKQQYAAKPHNSDPDMGVIPEVKLISVTPDPLGTLAFLNGTYKGVFYDSKTDPKLTDEDRMQALIDMQQTHLQAPLEAIKFHWRFDGVDRAFTHQLVRYRTGMYAQESMRFSVIGALRDAISIPPSLHETHRSDNIHLVRAQEAALSELKESDEYQMASKEQRWRMAHDYAIEIIDAVYHDMVENGMPAEDARGLMPTEVATRINWITDLRNMKEASGQRLCTQAQFHWRKVWNDMVIAISNYSDGDSSNDWQFKQIAASTFFRPICYQLNRCPMKAEFDRACTIRGRVDANAAEGRPSSEWHKDSHGPNGSGWTGVSVGAINPAEWLMDPSAARL